jgi:hypothetical protein
MNRQKTRARLGAMASVAASTPVLSGFFNVPFTGSVSTDFSVSAMGAGINVNATLENNALHVTGAAPIEQTIQWGIAAANNLSRASAEAFTLEGFVYRSSVINSTQPFHIFFD